MTTKKKNKRDTTINLLFIVSREERGRGRETSIFQYSLITAAIKLLPIRYAKKIAKIRFLRLLF